MQEWLCGSKQFGCALSQMWSAHEARIGMVYQAEGAKTQVFEVLGLVLEPFGIAFQGTLVIEREGGGYSVYDGCKIAFATGNVFADNLQCLGVVAVVSRG